MIMAHGGVSVITAQDEEATPDVPPGVDGTITLRNISQQEWQIVQVEGEGVFRSGNAQTVILEVGRRYYFDVSEVDSDFLPLDFRAHGGRVLFSQTEEAPEADMDVQADENGVAFTLTEELARDLAFFRATPYPQMTGIIASYDPAALEEDQDDQAE